MSIIVSQKIQYKYIHDSYIDWKENILSYVYSQIISLVETVMGHEVPSTIFQNQQHIAI